MKFVREGNVSNCEIHYLSMKAYRNIANEKPWDIEQLRLKHFKKLSLSLSLSLSLNFAVE